MGNNKLPASINRDMQAESPGLNDKRRKFIIAMTKRVLFKRCFTVFL